MFLFAASVGLIIILRFREVTQIEKVTIK